MLTRDHERLMRQKTRILNQIEIILKEYYPRAMEVFSELETHIARDFLKEYPTPRLYLSLTAGTGTTLSSATIISARHAATSFEEDQSTSAYQSPIRG